MRLSTYDSALVSGARLRQVASTVAAAAVVLRRWRCSLKSCCCCTLLTCECEAHSNVRLSLASTLHRLIGTSLHDEDELSAASRSVTTWIAGKVKLDRTSCNVVLGEQTESAVGNPSSDSSTEGLELGTTSNKHERAVISSRHL
jgi:hypothetical protein